MAKKEFNSIEEIVNNRNSIQTKKREGKKPSPYFLWGTQSVYYK